MSEADAGSSTQKCTHSAALESFALAHQGPGQMTLDRAESSGFPLRQRRGP